MRTLFNFLVNPLVRWVLRSRFHGLLSPALLLLTVQGRRSGKLYTVPVNYREEGSLLIVRSRRGRAWWENLRGGAPVTIWFKGEQRRAQAEATVNGEQVTIKIQLMNDNKGEVTWS